MNRKPFPCTVAVRSLCVASALLVAVFHNSSPRAGESPDPTRNYVGINVWFNNDYNGANTFVDMMKHSRSWENYAWNSPATIDTLGWPTQDCSTVIFGPNNALGVYKLVFEGRASSVGMMWTGGSVSNMQYNSGTNTTTADVTLTNTSTGGLRFQGTQRTAASATNTGIRNIRLYRPGYPTDGSAVFTSEWLSIMRRFQAIRFMDWLPTNTSPVESWSQRQRPIGGTMPALTIGSHSGEVGVAIEHFVQMCNEANTDLWINIPCMATDDYITRMAQMIRYGSDGINSYTSTQASPVYPPLNANLKVYVEYGNEIWNSAGGFQCFDWIKEKSDSIIGASGAVHPIIYDGFEDQYYSIARYSAWRTAVASLLFRQVFGDAAMMTRVRPVLEGQLGGNWFNPVEFPFLEGYYSTYRPAGDPYPNTDPKPVSYYVYGGGGSAYYGVYNWSTSPDAFFAAGNYPDSGFTRSSGHDALMARNYGVKRIAYEAGMSLDGSSTWGATDAQKRALCADTRMKDLTIAYHNAWSAAGGDLVVYYCAVGPANWEFTSSVRDSVSPKLKAMDALRDTLTRAEVTLGQRVPGTVVARQWIAAGIYENYAPSSTYNTTIGSEDCVVFKQTGEWCALPVNTIQEGMYTVSVRYASNAAINFAISMNGTVIDTIAGTSTGGSLVNSATVEVPVYLGLNAVRVRCLGGGMTLRSVTFAYVGPITTGVPGVTMGRLDRRAAAPALTAANGCLRLRAGEGVAYRLCDLRGRTVTRGAADAGPGNGAVLSVGRVGSGVYVVRTAGGSAAAALTR